MTRSTEAVSIKAAQKPHRCDWCAEHIDVGQPYSRYRWYGNGDAVTVKMHPECLTAMHELSRLEGGEIEFSPGDSPRGCCCGHDRGCTKCAAKKLAA